MREMLIGAARTYYMGMINKHMANMDVLLRNPTGIGEHQDIQASIDPRYDAGQRHSRNYFANAGIGSTLTFSHYLTGNLDNIKAFITTQGEKIAGNRSNEGVPVSGSFGGMVFKSGYLRSYDINFQPNQPVVANSTIVFF